MRLWLGYDGAWVLSRHKLTVHFDGETKYLAPEKPGRKCTDIGYDGDLLFRHLKLKRYEVVALDAEEVVRIAAPPESVGGRRDRSR